MEALIFACPKTRRPIEPETGIDQEISCDFQSVIIKCSMPPLLGKGCADH